MIDADSGGVHVYAHPSKTVINLQQHKEKDKVQGLMESFIIHSIFETPNVTYCMLSSSLYLPLVFLNLIFTIFILLLDSVYGNQSCSQPIRSCVLSYILQYQVTNQILLGYCGHLANCGYGNTSLQHILLISHAIMSVLT